MEKFPKISMNRASQFSGTRQERRAKEKVPPRITRHPQNRLTRFQTANYAQLLRFSQHIRNE